MGEGFQLDDRGVYEALAQALDATHENSPQLPVMARSFWSIQQALDDYLGANYASHDEAGQTISNAFTPDDEERSIAAFKGRHNATCIIKAALAHNYATVLGLSPTLVLGHMSEDPEEKPRDGHAFGIVPIPDSGYPAIMDYHAPVITSRGGEHHANLALFAISNKKADIIKAGGDVELDLTKNIHPMPLKGQPVFPYRRYGSRTWEARIGS